MATFESVIACCALSTLMVVMPISRAGLSAPSVMPDSHKAIDNLLCAVIDRATECGTGVSVAKKGAEMGLKVSTAI